MTHFHILVVCLGNICRSPLAERLMRHKLAVTGHGASVAVVSAGLEAPSGAVMDPLAANELTRLGGDWTNFSSRRLSAESVEAADLVLTATRDLRARTVAMQPRALKRVFTLNEFAALCERNLASGPHQQLERFVSEAARDRQAVAPLELNLVDPIGRPRAVHRDVADRIDRGLSSIVGRLSPLLPPPLVEQLGPAVRRLA
jgi:protein-tyrosine phosphatase